MRIDECYKCGEPVYEGTKWEVSIELGFTCEGCLANKIKSEQSYLENAAWLKSQYQKI